MIHFLIWEKILPLAQKLFCIKLIYKHRENLILIQNVSDIFNQYQKPLIKKLCFKSVFAALQEQYQRMEDQYNSLEKKVGFCDKLLSNRTDGNAQYS